MGIWRRRTHSATDSTADLAVGSADGGDPLGDALLVLDDLAEVLQLVADSDELLAEPAATSVQELREIRQALRPRTSDPANMDYGRGEWFTDLAWLLSNQDLTGLVLGEPASLGGPWLWLSELSHDGSSWTSEPSGRRGAGIDSAPQKASTAARYFLERRLGQLQDETSGYDIEDTWLRVSVWHTGRSDETGTSLAARAQSPDFTPDLAPLGQMLWTEHVEPNAVAIATPREVDNALPR